MGKHNATAFLSKRRTCSSLLRGLLTAIAIAQPLHAAQDASPAPDSPHSSIYRHIADRDLRIFHFPPIALAGTTGPAVLMVQGGAWSRGHPEQLYRSARYFAEQGFVALVLEYRLADAIHSPIDSFSDVCQGVAFIRNHAEQLGVAPSKIALWGISSSGQLAASAATVGCDAAKGRAPRGGPDALLLISPVVDAVADGLFRDLMREHGKPSAFSPTHTLTQQIPPTLIMQGDADRTTPIERSKTFCDRAQALGSQCELIPLEGQGHVLDTPSRDVVLARQVLFLRSVFEAPR